MATVDCDAVILGGGHNGLVAASYLADAGMDVLLLERRDLLGGACATEELFPGYRFSSCSYICHLLQDRVIDELGLREHGFDVYHLDPSRYQPFPDGSALRLWDDLERSQAELARFSQRDAEAYPEWLSFWKRAAGIIYPYFLTPPPTVSEIASRVRGTPDEALLDRLLTTSMTDLVTDFFESDQAQGAFIQAQDVGDPAASGSAWCYAYIKCNVFGRPENVGIVKGGNGRNRQRPRQGGAGARCGFADERGGGTNPGQKRKRVWRGACRRYGDPQPDRGLQRGSEAYVPEVAAARGAGCAISGAGESSENKDGISEIPRGAHGPAGFREGRIGL